MHAKLLGHEDGFGSTTPEFDEIISPLVEPADNMTLKKVVQLLSDLGFTKERPSSQTKLRVLMSSFLMQAMRLEVRAQRKGSERIIGIPHNEVYWRKRSQVGYKIALRFKDKLVEAGWIKHHVQASINLYHGDGNCHGYLVADFVAPFGRDLQFQSTNLIYESSTSASDKRTEDTENDPRVRALWARWKERPLLYKGNQMFTAPRRFNDLEHKRGGRFYGPWTNMKLEDRLECTILGEPVSEVDVSGMHVTLLSCITGDIPFSEVFSDAYSCDYDNRSQVKAIINETIGSGTWKHYTVGGLIKDAGVTQEAFTEIRKAFIEPHFTCLKGLQKGVLDSHALVYHESEIMLRVAEQIVDPVFILHDCLICQSRTAQDVGHLMQDIFVQYCREQGWTPVRPAYSIEAQRAGKRYVEGTTLV